MRIVNLTNWNIIVQQKDGGALFFPKTETPLITKAFNKKIVNGIDICSRHVENIEVFDKYPPNTYFIVGTNDAALLSPERNLLFARIISLDAEEGNALVSGFVKI